MSNGSRSSNVSSSAFTFVKFNMSENSSLFTIPWALITPKQSGGLKASAPLRPCFSYLTHILRACLFSGFRGAALGAVSAPDKQPPGAPPLLPSPARGGRRPANKQRARPPGTVGVGAAWGGLGRGAGEGSGRRLARDQLVRGGRVPSVGCVVSPRRPAVLAAAERGWTVAGAAEYRAAGVRRATTGS